MKNINSDLAYEHIRSRILSGEYPPNHALMTVALAGQIGVSRTPVREALRRLEVEGLVDIRAHVGARVKSMNFTEFRELCGLRLALESHAAGLAAANRTPVDLQEIRVALEGMRRITECMDSGRPGPSPLSELMREDVRFHVAVMRAAKNQLIKREILRLHLIHRIVSAAQTSPDHRAATSQDSGCRDVLHSHTMIYKAIELGDINGAETAMKRHLEDTLVRAEGQLIAAELTDEELCYTV